MVVEWIAALAATSGSALVAAAATDAWTQTKTGFARLFGRDQPQRAELTTNRLDSTAKAIAEAGDPEAVRNAERLTWQTRLADLLEENPDLADDLRALVNNINASLPTVGPTSIQVTNTGPALATGGGVANSGVVMGDVTGRDG